MKWTEENIRETAKKCPNVRYFHHYYRGAEKAAKRLGILHELFPNKEIHKPKYTKEELEEAAGLYSKRSEFQLAQPSMYNAANKLKILSLLFPVQLNRKYSDSELIEKSKKYTSRVEWETKDNGSYQVATRRGIVDKYGPAKMQGTSLAEKEILTFLQSLTSDFRTKRFANDYELDCYSETLKIGVEYNGFYWHREDTVGRWYHLEKTKYFEAMGIRVIHVWQDEWRDRVDQVKDFLRSACGANKIRIGARKCEFKEIETKIAKEFLERTHIQGSTPSVKLAIGCYSNDLLIGVCTFGVHHRDNEQVVLNRFACLPEHTVSGFLAKASKLAYKKLGPIISWADYSKSQARGYLSAGWALIKTHSPDYFYADAQGRKISKQSRKKSRVSTPSHMTEKQHADKDGLYRIWDCGKILLRFDNSNASLNP